MRAKGLRDEGSCDALGELARAARIEGGVRERGIAGFGRRLVKFRSHVA